MDSSGGCSYSFDADDWEREHGAETPLDGTWRCPHDAHDGDDRCIFHMSPEERRSKEITAKEVADEFLRKIRVAPPEERWFVGAEFENLRLNYSDVRARSRHPVHLYHVTVHGTLNISFATFRVHLIVSHSTIGFLDAVSAEFNYECYFAESTIEKTNFRAAEFDDYASFDGSTVGQARFTSVVFGGGSSFVETVFEAETDFSFSTFGQSSNFEGSEFRKSVYFSRIEMENGSFSEVTFGEGVGFAQAEFGECTFDSVFEEVSFEGARFRKELDFAAATFEDELVVDMTDCTISGGRMVVHSDEADVSEEIADDERAPQASAVYIDLTRATLGRVSLVAGSHNVFDHIILNETDYDGFDFARYSEDLSEIDWVIHTSLAPHDPTDPHGTEITYTKAKEAAHATGNVRAASNFFRREMRYRREGYLESLRTAGSLRRKLQLIGRATANYLLGALSGYGEKPWRVVGISVGTIFVCALLYPLIGGIRGTSSEGSVIYAFGGAVGFPAIPFPGWMVTLGRSGYFSLVTFTTLGYGDYQPATGAVRFLASMEAFAGALLMALLVFVLGRSVRW